ncbi:MAG: DnaD domain protein [Chloroflexi bacterium]|nr:DnaD domain protein [Chloroflexota bacterium]
MPVKSFAGFPAGAVRSTPIPDLFFSGLLPQIDDLAELKVILHCFWALQRKNGFPRYLSRAELEGDATLLRGLHFGGLSPEETLARALERAVARRVLLQLTLEGDDGGKVLYFLNTARSREAVAKLRSGELSLGQPLAHEQGVRVQGDRAHRQSEIFTMYEQNIGLLTPMLAEELAEAERTYPAAWLEDAFRVAVEYNKRNWRYIKRILERWAIEGKDGQEAGRRP